MDVADSAHIKFRGTSSTRSQDNVHGCCRQCSHQVQGNIEHRATSIRAWMLQTVLTSSSGEHRAPGNKYMCMVAAVSAHVKFRRTSSAWGTDIEVRAYGDLKVTQNSLRLTHTLHSLPKMFRALFKPESDTKQSSPDTQHSAFTSQNVQGTFKLESDTKQSSSDTQHSAFTSQNVQGTFKPESDTKQSSYAP